MEDGEYCQSYFGQNRQSFEIREIYKIQNLILKIIWTAERCQNRTSCQNADKMFYLKLTNMPNKPNRSLRQIYIHHANPKNYKISQICQLVMKLI